MQWQYGGISYKWSKVILTWQLVIVFVVIYPLSFSLFPSPAVAVVTIVAMVATVAMGQAGEEVSSDRVRIVSPATVSPVSAEVVVVDSLGVAQEQGLLQVGRVYASE